MKIKKKCPRCQYKMMASLTSCPNCSLNFEKFNSATNKEAKVAISQGEKDRVIMRKGFPSDVRKIPFLLITIFLGMFGVHHYSVGRWKMGLTYSIFFLIGCTNAILTSFLGGKLSGGLYEVFSFLVLGWGLVLILWILDVVKVITNSYRVPVSRKG